MEKIKVVKIVKGVGMLFSIGSMLLTAWATSRENEITLAKLVENSNK